eukprot:TRINITY_DN7654_c0_g1_i5.p1 TRINITY_DN7654_c0_g1~~TRINITY_DN7654_c0_g1_i5.p1  ORF type:complete len:112 (+),score=21.73 TRINITY_DN7654_c0_g1_i5:30-338(+)
MKSNNTVYMATIVLMALVGTSLAVQPIKVTPPTTYPKAPTLSLSLSLSLSLDRHTPPTLTPWSSSPTRPETCPLSVFWTALRVKTPSASLALSSCSLKSMFS